MCFTENPELHLSHRAVGNPGTKLPAAVKNHTFLWYFCTAAGSGLLSEQAQECSAAVLGRRIWNRLVLAAALDDVS